MKTRFVAAALGAALAFGAAPASAYTTIYAFGDSLSDAGNLFALTGMPPSPYVGGHFSNGPTWVEDLSLKLGLGPLAPSLNGGTDFAFGGAVTGSASVIDLDSQVAAFQGAIAAAHVSATTLNGALFTLDIGANDILNALSDPATAAAVITGAAQSAAADVEALYADGARSFLYYEVPNLGLTPDAEAAGPAAQAAADELAQLFNATLLGTLASIESGSPPLKVFVLDTYDLLTDIVESPGHLGFGDVSDECITTPACVSGTLADQDKYLFWDDLHPTEGGHLLAADLAYAIAAPEASTWAMMLAGFAGLGFASWRAQRRRLPAGAAS